MRVISMVPSWTETLLYCGVNVVGRTRFCIHPKNAMKDIPIVGGTKEWNWEKIQALKPDLILLDREENPVSMSEQSLISWYATHITEVMDMPSALKDLGKILKNKKLDDLANRWQALCAQPPKPLIKIWDSLPGLIEWGRKPTLPPQQILYIIWKNPWMCVSQNTFIGSVLKMVGINTLVFPKPYPEVDLAQFKAEDTLLLLSSEPYPFFAKKTDFINLEHSHAFVQGEYFSWFGVRSLHFLEQEFNLAL